MPTFIYKAKDKSGKILEGTIIADNQQGVIDKLDKTGYFPISIEPEVKFKKNDISIKRINLKEITIFIRQLSDLLEGGVSLTKSLSIPSLQTQNKRLKMIINQINKDIQQGMKFSDALNKYNNIFPVYLISMVKAGEVGGIFNESLNKSCEYLEKIDDLKTKITTSLTYPVFLLSVGTITIFFLMTFVVPKLIIMFEDLGQNLPLPTLILIGSSNFISKYWWIIIAVGVIIIFGLKRLFSTESGNLFTHKFLLSLPVFGKIINKIEVLKFTLTLGTLLTNGVPILEALKVANLSSRNLIFKLEIDKIYKEVNEGKNFTLALNNKRCFSPLMINMLSTSEEGGFLEKALLKISSNYEKELDRTFKIIISILEPIVILIMGLVVGFIVIAFLLPIFKMNILIE